MRHTVHRFIHGTVLKRPALLALIAFVLSSSSSMAIAAQNGAAQCRPTGPLVQLPGLSEASGLAVSRRVPGRLWTHNDSGEPVLASVDARGSVTGRVRLTGATVEDWEAIAVGPRGTGWWPYVGDIGDNGARRKRVTITSGWTRSPGCVPAESARALCESTSFLKNAAAICNLPAL
jgi:hypothetical protein